MKLTSYGISKKLDEIGFKADFDWCYKKNDEKVGLWSWDFEVSAWENEKESDYYKAYDLETILEALPKERNLLTDYNHYLKINFENGKKHEKAVIGYYLLNEGYHPDFYIEKQSGESLADCAARLLILLHEKGLVEFNNNQKSEG